MLDISCPLFPDGALFGFSGIRCSHQLAQISNGIFFFQRQHDYRAAGHEIGQRIVKSLARVHRIELFRLVLGNLQHLQAENAEIAFFKLLNDVSDSIFANCIGLDDSKCALQSLHVRVA